MKRTLILLFFLVPRPYVHGQVNTDSLLRVWNDATKHDTVRLEALNLFAREAFMFTYPDSAFHYAQLGHNRAQKLGLTRQTAAFLNTQGFSFYVRGELDSALIRYGRSMKLAEKINDLKGMGAVLNNMGMVHMVRSENTEAIRCYEQSLAMQEKLGNDKARAVILNNMGIIRTDMGDHVRAIDCYNRSLKLSETLTNRKLIANTLNNIGNVYQDQKDYDLALEFYGRSLGVSRADGDSSGCAMSLNNMGIIYRNRNENDKARQFYERSLNIYRLQGDKRGEASVLANFGAIKRDTKDFDGAMMLFNQQLVLCEEMRDVRGMSAALGNMAHIHRDKGDHRSAIPLDIRSLELAREAEEPRGMRDAAQSLFISYKATGNTAKALEMHELYVAMRDSIMSEENQRETIRTEFSRENEQSKAEIGILNLENEKKEAERLAERRKRFLTLGGGTAMVLLLSVGGGWFYTDRRKRHLAELQWAAFEKNLVENDYLRSRLNTHFMKNALQSINGLISNDQHTKAQEYIDRFHRLMQWTLENASSDTVSLSEELEMMEHYLTLEQPCAEDGLSWEVQVAADVDADDVMLPPLILQPFLENALLHGMKNTGRPGHLRIAVERKGDEVVCSVEDNGRGMASGAEAKPRSTGLRLVRERLAMFSPTAAMRMENTGSGTRAEVRVAA